MAHQNKIYPIDNNTIMKNTILLNSFILCLFILWNISTQAQTKIIAHKSHSGKMETFSAKGDGNFGEIEPPMKIDTIIKISDTSVVQISRMGWHHEDVMRIVDTIYNHGICNKPDVTIAHLKKYYPKTKLLGFVTVKDPTVGDPKQEQQKILKDLELIEEEKKQQKEQQNSNENQNQVPLLIGFLLMLMLLFIVGNWAIVSRNKLHYEAG